MSALGTTEETKDIVPYYGAKWDMEQAVRGSGLPHVIFRPSFVFAPDGGILPTFRQAREADAGHADRRVGGAASPADLGRRPRGVSSCGRSTTTASTNRTLELGGPDVVSWNSSGRDSSRRSGFGGRASTCRWR